MYMIGSFDIIKVYLKTSHKFYEDTLIVSRTCSLSLLITHKETVLSDKFLLS